jgi:tRNA U55 pseudouridine synthase TruB
MATLRRDRAGLFSLESSHTLEEIEALDTDARLLLLSPTESLFADLPAVKLAPFYEKLSRSGCEIYQKKIGTRLDIGSRVRLCSQDGDFYALGEVREYENGSAIKSIKMFDI